MEGGDTISHSPTAAASPPTPPLRPDRPYLLLIRYEAVSSTPVTGLEMVALRSCEARDRIYPNPHSCPYAPLPGPNTPQHQLDQLPICPLCGITSNQPTKSRSALATDTDCKGTHSWLRQPLHKIDFVVRDDVEVAHDVGPVPLVLLLDRRQQVLGVAVVIVVAAEEPAGSAGGLGEREYRQMFRSPG